MTGVLAAAAILQLCTTDAKFAQKDHRKRLKTDRAYIKIKKCGIRKKLLISYNAET